MTNFTLLIYPTCKKKGFFLFYFTFILYPHFLHDFLCPDLKSYYFFYTAFLVPTSFIIFQLFLFPSICSNSRPISFKTVPSLFVNRLVFNSCSHSMFIFFQHSSLPNCFYFSWEQFLSYCSAGLCRCYDMSMAFSNTKQTHASVIWHMIRLMVFSKNTVASVIIKILICHMTVPPPSLFPIKQCKGFWPHLNLNFYAPFKSCLKCHLCFQISTPFSSSSSTFIRSGQQLMLIYFIFVLFDFFCLFVCYSSFTKKCW